MASIESKLFNLLLIIIKKKMFLEMQFAFGKFDFYNCKEPPQETYKHCQVTISKTNGRNVFRLSPKSKSSGRHILYLHGGAYVQSFVKQHWLFLTMLVKETGCIITAPDYLLAPQHTFVDTYAMVTPIYSSVVLEAGANNTILMGDSAGGGLALGLAQKIHSQSMPMAQQIILLSPWLDITLDNPDIKKIDKKDPFLSVRGLKQAGLSYAGGADPKHFMLSPINGSLDALGKISVFIGSRDILVADARRLKNLANDRGFPLHFREYPDMVHVWMFLNFRESREAKREIIDLILKH